MRPTRAYTTFSCVLFGLVLALVLGAPVRAEDEESLYEETVMVLCEAWRVTAPEVLAEIQAITERRPDGAEEVRRRLLDGGGERLAHLLTPAVHGEDVSLSNLRRIPQTVRSTSSSGAVTTRSGYQEVGTRLEMLQQRVGEGRVALEFDLRVTVPWAGGDDVPATQGTLQLQTTITAPLGALRMFLSRAGDGDAVVVFLRASRLGEETARLERPEAGGGGFSDREIQRFEALKALVDLKERKEQLETMIGRQLARLGVELSDEQHSVVVERTLAYREALRERMRAGVDRETMQAEMGALRQDYADKLNAVLDAETAAKIVEGLGRAPGFGRGRER
jgi:hypothetical protein